MKGNLDFSEEDIKDLIYAECKALEVTAKKYSDAMLSGAYKSIKRGAGVEFEEARIYTPSDDSRRIDWKVTARKQKPYIKSFREEKDQSMYLIVDGTLSTLLGIENTKSKKILEVAAFIGSIASFNQDKIGSICFTNTGLNFNKVKRGFSSVYKILHDIVSLSVRTSSVDSLVWNNAQPAMSFKEALKNVQRFIKRRSKIFLISDFNFPIDFEAEISQISNKHDLFCVSVYDAIEDDLPNSGTFFTKNPETGEEQILQLSNNLVRNFLINEMQEHKKNLENAFKRLEIPYVTLNTSTNTREVLFRFFRGLK